jgi:hypothetical protein
LMDGPQPTAGHTEDGREGGQGRVGGVGIRVQSGAAARVGLCLPQSITGFGGVVTGVCSLEWSQVCVHTSGHM